MALKRQQEQEQNIFNQSHGKSKGRPQSIQLLKESDQMQQDPGTNPQPQIRIRKDAIRSKPTRDLKKFEENLLHSKTEMTS